MAQQLIGNIAERSIRRSTATNTRRSSATLVKAKLKGKPLPDEGDDEKPAKTRVIDLVARLQESLATTSGRKRATGKVSGKTAAKRATARGARKRRVS